MEILNGIALVTGWAVWTIALALAAGYTLGFVKVERVTAPKSND